MVRQFLTETIVSPSFIKKGVYLRKFIYVYLLFYAIYLLFNYNSLLSQNSIIVPYPISGYGLFTITHLLSHPLIANFSWLFALLLIGFCLVGFGSKLPRIIAFIIWFLVINLNNRVYAINTAGDSLINIFLFYLIFFGAEKKYKNNLLNSLSNSFSGYAVLFCLIQVLVVYFFSAWYKWQDTDWIRGEAVYYILQLPQYSNFSIVYSLVQLPFISYILTYSVLLYQSLFPVLIFFPATKKSMILIGITIHLAIAFFMGLYFFSAIIIISYVLFKEYKKP